jgi:hypothetical protein
MKKYKTAIIVAGVIGGGIMLYLLYQYSQWASNKSGVSFLTYLTLPNQIG